MQWLVFIPSAYAHMSGSELQVDSVPLPSKSIFARARWVKHTFALLALGALCERNLLE